MQISKINIDNQDQSPSFKYSIELDGILYSLEFSYVERDESWFLSIYDTEQNPLVLGIKLVINFPLLYKFKVNGMPKGELLLIDTIGSDEPCKFTDLGSRCLLYYLTEW